MVNVEKCNTTEFILKTYKLTSTQSIPFYTFFLQQDYQLLER